MSTDVEPKVTVVETDLKAGALNLPSVIMQSITHIAPAIGALFFIQFIMGSAGLAMTVGYPIGVFFVLLTGIGLSELARAMPSAGGYYTYVARGIHPRAGFLVSWIYMLFSPTVAGPVLVFTGTIFAGQLGIAEGSVQPFALGFMVVGVTLVMLLQYRGVQVSGKALVIFGGAEVAIIAALGLWGFLTPGPGGFNLEPLNPSTFFAASGFAIGILFAIQAMTGWEAAAPMGEETANPRRNVPIALIGSILAIGVFLTIVTFGLIVGWGTDIALDPDKGMASASDLPGLVLANRYWGIGSNLVLLAILSSAFAVSLATSNVSTRMWFTMARTGTLPKGLGKVHLAYRTPTNAILAQYVLSLALGAGLYLWLSGDIVAFSGSVQGMAVLFIYIAGNIAVYRVYRTERRQEFSVWKHMLVPILSTLAMLWVAYQVLIAIPEGRVGWAIPFTLLWVVAGLIVAISLPSHTVARAGESATERAATEEEIRALQSEW